MAVIKAILTGVSIASLTLLASCGEGELTAAEQKARDRAAISAVEAAQTPPAQLVFPEVMTAADLADAKFSGGGCAMLAPPPADGALALTNDTLAILKIDGEVVRLVVDPGSASQPFGLRRKFDGKRHSLTLETSEADAGRPDNSGEYDGTMTLRDGSDRVVFEQRGTVRCEP
ncbi:hypothetical protein [Altererythrobacter aquiaggeris]|uniref:hypothetical protein n=1 Tax=Aestuarierythrobacter aquiaggeris TaxID=1898396 RepID=UPI0030187A11